MGSCGTCKFAKEMLEDITLRQCRRFPPEVRLTPQGPMMVLPLVRPLEDYCGEYQSRLESVQ